MKQAEIFENLSNISNFIDEVNISLKKGDLYFLEKNIGEMMPKTIILDPSFVQDLISLKKNYLTKLIELSQASKQNLMKKIGDI